MLSAVGVDGMVVDGELVGLVLEVSLDEAQSNARIIFGWALGHFHLTSTRLPDINNTGLHLATKYTKQTSTCDAHISRSDQQWQTLELAFAAQGQRLLCREDQGSIQQDQWKTILDASTYTSRLSRAL